MMTHSSMSLDHYPDSTQADLDKTLESLPGWLRQRQLKLNAVLSEIISLGQGLIGSEIWLPALDGILLLPIQMDPWCNPGRLLSMKAQVILIAKSAFFHHRHIRQLIPSLSSQHLAMVIHATTVTRFMRAYS